MSERVLVCRSCGGANLHVFLSLGRTPLADALVSPDRLDTAEERFPLDVAVCPDCSLVQITEEVAPEKLFVDNYLYFSSFSPYLLAHSRDHALNLISSRGLGSESLVVEIASNDGYLLKNFKDAGVAVLGIDPAPDQANAAEEAGVETLQAFFGAELAGELRAAGRRADVIIANNVMAHVPDLNGFVEGIAILLADDGVATIENPYVRDLVGNCEFDTIYHEHFCYFSCTAVNTLMRRHGLYLNHVEHFADLHGGTLRWWVGPSEQVSPQAKGYLDQEQASGLTGVDFYRDFGGRVERTKDSLVELLRGLKGEGRSIAAYGAAAKGSTLLNYAGIDTGLIDFVVDRNVHKHGLCMPGVHVPIRDPAALVEAMPDYVLLLAWNFKDEIVDQQREYLARGGRFIIPIPEPTVI